MNDSKNFLVTTYQGETDTWNTKPPLLIIIQSIFINLFGLSELSVRLPSAIAATITVLFVFLFVSKYTKSNFLGFFSSFILLATPGLVDLHGVRTGDYEATLMVFCTLYSFLYLFYIETKKTKYLYLFSIFFTLAFMTKSSAALLFLPALLIYSIYRKRLVYMLKSKHLYIAMAIPLIVIGAYYTYREMLHPGYWQIIYENEFGGRYIGTIENHKSEPLFYLNFFVYVKLKYWLFLALPGLIFTFFEKNYRIKRLFIFLSLLSITHLIIISFANTKLHWYGLPEYPFWSIMAAISLYQIICCVSRLLKRKILINTITTILIVVALFFPIVDTIGRIKQYENEFIPANTKMFLRDEITKYIDKDDKITVLTTMFSQNLLFYLRVLQIDGYDITIGEFNNISQYDIVLLDEYEIPKSLVESVNTLFVTQTIREYHETVVLLKIVKERTYEEAVDYAKQQLSSSDNNNEAGNNNVTCSKADSIVQNAMSVLHYEK